MYLLLVFYLYHPANVRMIVTPGSDILTGSLGKVYLLTLFFHALKGKNLMFYFFILLTEIF